PIRVLLKSRPIPSYPQAFLSRFRGTGRIAPHGNGALHAVSETLVGAARGVQRKARSAKRSPWNQNLPDRLARAAMLDTRPTARWKRATEASDRIEPSLPVDRQPFENRPQLRGHRTSLVGADLAPGPTRPF
ncbi:MAG TPA: hypothetical protein PK867_22035, partial [Pirellulales bacterium]|nr:hypothetical protein [Pirellulales bacterium]